jgi:predicted transcriptional regulator
MAEDELLRITADVVAAYVGNNTLPTTQLADVINAVYHSLRGLDDPAAAAPPEPLKPAVPIRKSITADYLVCLEDGKRLKMLKRHLRSTYNLTPEFAKKIGLGRATGRQSARGASAAKK